MPNRYYVRKFLNRPGHQGGAYVLASVEDTSKSSDARESAFADFQRHAPQGENFHFAQIIGFAQVPQFDQRHQKRHQNVMVVSTVSP